MGVFGLMLFFIAMNILFSSSTESPAQTIPAQKSPTEYTGTTIQTAKEVSQYIGGLNFHYLQGKSIAGDSLYLSYAHQSFSSFDQHVRNLWDRPVDHRIIGLAVKVSVHGDSSQLFQFVGNETPEGLQIRSANFSTYEALKARPNSLPEILDQVVSINIIDKKRIEWRMDSFDALHLRDFTNLSVTSSDKSPLQITLGEIQTGVMLSGGEWMDVVRLNLGANFAQKPEIVTEDLNFGILSISYVSKRLAMERASFEGISLTRFTELLAALQKKEPSLNLQAIQARTQSELAPSLGLPESESMSGERIVQMAQYFFSEEGVQDLKPAWEKAIFLSCANPKTLHTPFFTEDDQSFGYQWGYSVDKETGTRTYITNMHYQFVVEEGSLYMREGTRGWPEKVPLNAITR